MDPSQPAGSRRRTTAIIAAAGLACLAIAIPVSGAFGADDNGNNRRGAVAATGWAGLRPAACPQGPAPAAGWAGHAQRQMPEAPRQRAGQEPGQRELGQLRHGPPGRLARFVATKEPADVGVGRLLRR